MKLALTLASSLLLSACVFVPFDRGPAPKSGGGGNVTLCHKGKKTMQLPESAAQAHLDHGDSLGPC